MNTSGVYDIYYFHRNFKKTLFNKYEMLYEQHKELQVKLLHKET